MSETVQENTTHAATNRVWMGIQHVRTILVVCHPIADGVAERLRNGVNLKAWFLSTQILSTGLGVLGEEDMQKMQCHETAGRAFMLQLRLTKGRHCLAKTLITLTFVYLPASQRFTCKMMR